ncbi:MAG: hypothetical protein A3E80_03345 [Chlamydiae bacterium RIFCSPHIGHO2_12_FULL_49_9]|nr:MAG: hypothetical protein A3E80_03345 [Chlamydiae bacterium RIFCSPHIGHO2_12_FULL_49_9]
MTASQITESFPSVKKIVKTVQKFCSSNKEKGEWPSSESAVRAIIQMGAESPFATAILRYNRRVLIDQAEWDACLARLHKAPKYQPLMQEVSDAQSISKPTSRRTDRLLGSEKHLVRV